MLRKLLTPLDVVSIGFLSFLILLCLVFSARLDVWPWLVLVDLVGVGCILALARQAERKPTRLWIGFHRWYCYPIVLLVFKQIYLMVRPIHPIDYDHVFIAIDRAMFGVDPTVWISQFAHPLITEILQIAYFSYYILFIVLGVEIYRRLPIGDFDHAAFMIVYGFYLSYLGYFLMPGVGPRFTLHDFALLGNDLPGLWLTDTMRKIINAGESIPAYLPNPQDYVQRDVFPSGHTQLTLITVILAFRYKLKSRVFITVMASLLFIATVYLRYHYVIDLFGGVAFCAVTFWTGDRFQRWWSGEKKRVNNEF